MNPLSTDQLGQVSALGLLLLEAHRAGRLPPDAVVAFTSHLLVRIPAASPNVGDLEIHDDDTEFTVVVGHHTHHHIMTWATDPPNPSRERHKALEDLLTDLDHIVADRTVIWSSPRGAGGTFGIDLGPEHLESGAEAWLWSGRRYPG